MASRILNIIREFLLEVEKDNPFDLVLKGGTALSIYYLNSHRESEDLDFDADKHLIKKYKEIQNYLTAILERLKRKQIVKDFKITKSAFASTNRYHIKLELKTHKIIYSKIDIDFVELPKNLIKVGQLNLYPTERIFITKALTFVNRKEFKDLYDISYLIRKVDIALFKKKENVIQLIEEVIQTIQQEDIKKIFKLAFRNVDLKFKNLKETELNNFIKKTINELGVLINKLKSLEED
ncbi:nucleotidyl transferase AbiEii/AbiGii toxin family protein [Candidatus Woesearchaeota archaeon]|nr:nucleotidyl transferase AbiEii/AbiGii toxin family protein [Candidatus Woesearchaeota archaeon]